MATTPESTTIPSAPALARAIVYDRETHDYAMYLDGDLVGYARTYHDAERSLDALVAEILALHAASALPLPPLDAVGETLAELAVSAGDPALFNEARAQLDAGVTLVADGAGFWVDSCLVRPAPSRVGWPWACPCETAPCWHAALAEALTLTRERLLELASDDALVCEVGR
jgi:hypothetical protein